MKLIMFALLLPLTTGLASAGGLFTELSNGTCCFHNGVTIGPGFHIDNSITVTHLGAYTESPAGHWGASNVYLAAVGGSLIASGVVGDGATRSSDGFAYIPITPVVLTPGDYLVTADTFGDGEGRFELYIPGSTITMASGFTLLGTWSYAGAPTAPSAATYTDRLWVGGGLQFAEDSGSGVPEPATTALIGLGVLGLGIARKRVGKVS